MATFSKEPLSGGTANGRGIAVGATSTTIHTGSSTTTTYDELWLYAMNYDTVPRKLTVEWGGTGASDDIEFTVPPESGLYLVVPGLILKGAATPLVVSAFAAAASAISIFGYVNRITV